jgi:hypothetical protein
MATIRRKKLEHKAENGSGRFGLLELSSSDEDLLARNTPLAEAIATAFVDALYEGLISEPLSLSGAKLAKSKAEYRGYFANIFSGGELLRDAGNAEFVSGLSTRTYLRGLPFADELFTLTSMNIHH